MRARGLLLAIFLLPGAAAEPFGAALDVQGPVTFVGMSELLVGWTGSVQDARAGAMPAVEVLVAGTAELVTYRYLLVERDPQNPAGFGRDARLIDRVPEPLGPVQGRVRVTDAEAAASLRLVPDADAARAVPLVGGFALGLRRDLASELAPYGDAQPREERAATFPAPGGHLLAGAIAPGPFEGQLVLTGAVLRHSGGSVDTRWTLTGPDVPEAGAAGLLETKVLVVQGTIDPAGPLDPVAWLSLVDRLDGTLSGDLLLQNAQGTGTLNGTPLPAGIHQLQAVGPLEVAADYSRDAAAWTITGDPSFVAVNAQTVAGERWAWLAIEAVAAAGLLAAAAAVLVRYGHALLPAALLNRADPLRNHHRLDLLAAISSDPGINQLQLAERLGLARASVRHHLGILLRADLITERPFGRELAYTLNSGSMEFAARTDSGGRVQAASAMTELRQPSRQLIVETLQDLGEADFTAMAEHWKARGLEAMPPDLVSYHCQRLWRNGLLERRREGRTVRWKVAFDQEGALRHYREAFLVKNRLVGIKQALDAGRTGEQDIVDYLASQGIRTGTREVGRKLALMRACGFLPAAPSASGPTPASPAARIRAAR